MPTGCKALKGELGGFHRIRVGSYRVIYEIQEMAIKILVLRIAPRGSVYQP
jgi:mRNA interferase RelE/StbE